MCWKCKELGFDPDPMTPEDLADKDSFQKKMAETALLAPSRIMAPNFIASMKSYLDEIGVNRDSKISVLIEIPPEEGSDKPIMFNLIGDHTDLQKLIALLEFMKTQECTSEYTEVSPDGDIRIITADEVH